MGMNARLLTSAFSRSLRTATETLKDIAQDAFEDAVRNVGRWAKGTAILYGIGAALALMAVFALGHGLAEVLTAVGLPAFAGHLIIAVLGGLAAFLIFKKGSKRHIVPREEDDHDRPQLKIRIVAPRRPRTARRSRRVYDVHRARRGWEVTGPRSERRSFRSRSRAVTAARRSARAAAGQVVIHGADGRIHAS